MGATAIVEIDTEADKDSRAIFEKQQEINKVTAIYEWFLFTLNSLPATVIF